MRRDEIVKLLKCAVQSLVLLFLASCGGSGGNETPEVAMFDGSRASLSGFYSESQLVATESLGFSLNFGDSPPNIEGVYRVNPVVLQSTTLANDLLEVGSTILPFDVTFSDQNADSLSISVDIGTDLIETTSAVISGSGASFSVFALISLPVAGENSRMALSGNISEFGIEDFQYAPFVVGAGGIRLFEDLDNLSERL